MIPDFEVDCAGAAKLFPSWPCDDTIAITGLLWDIIVVSFAFKCVKLLVRCVVFLQATVTSLTESLGTRVSAKKNVFRTCK